VECNSYPSKEFLHGEYPTQCCKDVLTYVYWPETQIRQQDHVGRILRDQSKTFSDGPKAASASYVGDGPCWNRGYHEVAAVRENRNSVSSYTKTIPPSLVRNSFDIRGMVPARSRNRTAREVVKLFPVLLREWRSQKALAIQFLRRIGRRRFRHVVIVPLHARGIDFQMNRSGLVGEQVVAMV